MEIVDSYTNSDDWVLCEQDALEFNDEEVDKLLEILKGCFKSLLGNFVISARSETGCNSFAHDKFADNLSKCGN